MVIHCLFILKKAFKGKGFGSALIEACENDARRQNMHGVVVVASKSTWMAKKEIFLKKGYELTDEAPPATFSGNWREKLSQLARESPNPYGIFSIIWNGA
jgi:N-acetylglutamate synthase-like GNAT family acetyltransferase